MTGKEHQQIKGLWAKRYRTPFVTQGSRGGIKLIARKSY